MVIARQSPAEIDAMLPDSRRVAAAQAAHIATIDPDHPSIARLQAIASGEDADAPIFTAKQLATADDAEIPWCWRGYIAYGALTELSGRAKAAGKSTLVLSLVSAIVGGRDFLGHATQRSPVLILTEQSRPSLREIIVRTGLGDREDVYFLSWHDTRSKPWATVVEEAIEFAFGVDAGLVVVDTLPQFASIAGDAENDSGAALAALAPLQAAAAAFSIAILIVRHDRKGGGEVGESARGSSAFTGAVDVVLQLARQRDAGPGATVRILSALSRFSETPDELVIDLTDDGYAVLGHDAGSLAYDAARRLIVQIVADGGERTRKDIQDALAGLGDTTKPTMRDAALNSLVNAGEITRSGKGVRGDPHLFVRAVSPILPVSPTERLGESAKVSPIPLIGMGETESNGGIVGFDFVSPSDDEPNPPTCSCGKPKVQATPDRWVCTNPDHKPGTSDSVSLVGWPPPEPDDAEPESALDEVLL
jgi:hypothetical protein